MKKRIYRTIWLLFYIPLFVLECVLFLILTFLHPLIGAFYFIKTGSLEQIPYTPPEPVTYIDKKYKSLLEKVENEP